MTPVEALLAAFDARLVLAMVPTPAHAWYRCERCDEFQLRRAGRVQGLCVMTPHCKGVMVPYLEARCEGCGEPLTGRSRDGRYCRASCRRGAVA